MKDLIEMLDRAAKLDDSSKKPLTESAKGDAAKKLEDAAKSVKCRLTTGFKRYALETPEYVDNIIEDELLYCGNALCKEFPNMKYWKFGEKSKLTDMYGNYCVVETGTDEGKILVQLDGDGRIYHLEESVNQLAEDSDEHDEFDGSLTEETDSSEGIYVDSGYTDSGEKIGLYRIEEVGRIYKKENNSGASTCIFEGDWQSAWKEFEQLSIPRGKLKYIELNSAGSADFDWTEETSGLSRSDKQKVLQIVTNNFTLNSGIIRTEWPVTAQSLAKTLSKYYQDVEIDDQYRVGYHFESAIFYSNPV